VAYDEELAERVRDVLAMRENVVERKMFGGLAVMLAGNMACGVLAEDLIVRIGPQAYESALAKPHARPFEFTGRPMKGFVVVGPEGVADDEALAEWVESGAEFASSLPGK